MLQYAVMWVWDMWLPLVGVENVIPYGGAFYPVSRGYVVPPMCGGCVAGSILWMGGYRYVAPPVGKIYVAPPVGRIEVALGVGYIIMWMEALWLWRSVFVLQIMISFIFKVLIQIVFGWYWKHFCMSSKK